MKKTISTIANTIFWLCICLALIALVFQTEAFTAFFFSSIAALLSAVMPCVIIIAGIYIVIKALFR